MQPASTSELRVFISYARRDARHLALQLCQSLNEAGIHTWLDVREIKGGISWTREIETAIDDSSTTLALISPASYTSEVCRAEQMRALRKGKRVIPILVYEDVERPLYLETLHYLDFSRIQAVDMDSGNNGSHVRLSRTLR